MRNFDFSSLFWRLESHLIEILIHFVVLPVALISLFTVHRCISDFLALRFRDVCRAGHSLLRAFKDTGTGWCFVQRLSLMEISRNLRPFLVLLFYIFFREVASTKARTQTVRSWIWINLLHWIFTAWAQERSGGRLLTVCVYSTGITQVTLVVKRSLRNSWLGFEYQNILSFLVWNLLSYLLGLLNGAVTLNLSSAWSRRFGLYLLRMIFLSSLCCLFWESLFALNLISVRTTKSLTILSFILWAITSSTFSTL